MLWIHDAYSHTTTKKNLFKSLTSRNHDYDTTIKFNAASDWRMHKLNLIENKFITHCTARCFIVILLHKETYELALCIRMWETARFYSTNTLLWSQLVRKIYSCFILLWPHFDYIINRLKCKTWRSFEKNDKQNYSAQKELMIQNYENRCNWFFSCIWRLFSLLFNIKHLFSANPKKKQKQKQNITMIMFILGNNTIQQVDCDWRIRVKIG